MNYYNRYFAEGLDNPEVYHSFLSLLFAYSDAFSLIYFKPRENGKTTETTREIKKRLSPFQISSEKVSQWPGTITMNQSGHVYRMITYKIDYSKIFNIVDVLEQVNTLYDWNYPTYPEDLCFYKDGYAVFWSIVHEHMNELYLKEDSFPGIYDFESIGAKLISRGKVAETDLFHHIY